MIRRVRTTAVRAAVPALLAALLSVVAVASVAAAVPSSVTLGSGSSGTLGNYLTGPNGHTLYTLSSDPTNGSSCAGQCATFWPPLVVASGGTVHGPAGAMGTFSTFKRSDGTTQVAFGGRALYYFLQDTAAGQTTGEGVVAFGGTWHVAHVQIGSATASPSAAVGGVTSAPAQGTPPPTSTVPGNDNTAPASRAAFLLLVALAGAAGVVGLRYRAARR